MADENVTGATVGDVRYLVAYLDVNTNNLYDANGNLYGNSTLTSTLGNEFVLELHYVKDISTSENPDNWTVWDGLEGQTVSSTLAFDNDFVHALEGSVTADTAVESTSIEVNVSNLDKDTLSPAGILVINPFEITYTNPNTGVSINQKVMVNYSSFEFVEGTTNTYRFMITDIDGLEVNVPAGVLVRVSDPMYMLVDSDSIYEANIQPRFDEGVFKFPMKILSRKLLKALDYSNSSGVSGTLEHNIYIERNNLNGVVATGSTTICYRDKSLDKVAQDIDYYAWQNTTNSVTTTLYTKSEIPVLNEKAYKKLSNGTLVDANMVVSSDSSTASSTQFKKSDGTGSAATYTKTTSLNEYGPYVFCGWNDKANPTPTIYYTKGNDIQDGTAVYSIDAQTNIATVVSGTTVDPSYDTDYVLYRTFSFPFIVKNLVDYGVSLNIPVDDTDWVKDYIISIVHNNMDEIFTVASKAQFGVVKVGDNISVSNGEISVPIATGSTVGVMFISGGTTGSNGVQLALNTTTGALALTVNQAGASTYGTTALLTSFDASNLPTGSYWSTDNATKYSTTLTTVKNFVSAVLDNSDVGLSVDATTGKAQIADASTSQKGIVLLVNDADSSDMSSETKAITPHAVSAVAESLTSEINLKQAIITCDTTTGIELVNGSTVKNDIATVEEVVKGTTGSNLVDADGLTGALSLGQAVDVTSQPYQSIGTVTYSGTDENATYLDTITWEFTQGTSSSTQYFGFINAGINTGKWFPKAAKDLKYLFIVDVKCDKSVDINTWSPNTIIYRSNTTVSVPANTVIRLGILTPVQTATNPTLTFGISVSSAANTTYTFTMTNVRQYEVTSLTDDAIAYLASSVTNPNPDKLFRSLSFFDISSRYLVKSDMVNPWTYLITMKTNSPAMTVGSGLAYQLSLTDGAEHEITVDTFPTNAYGKDAHIQLLLANNSTAVFKSPLNLIDALVPNAANNLTVKFRAGQANIYVDDTDAGYIVSVSGGSESGSLYYGIVTSTDKYIVFSKTVDGTAITIPDIASITKNDLSVIGNGTENTIISNSTFRIYGTDFNNLTITGCTAGGRDILEQSNVTNCVFDDCRCGIYGIVSNQNGYRINNCVFRNNGISSDAYVVFVLGTATIVQDCLFELNNSLRTYSIYRSGTGTVKNCTFKNNRIAINREGKGAVLLIEDCTFEKPTVEGVANYISGVFTENLPGTTILNGINKIDTYINDNIACSIHIVSDSTLDLTDNTNRNVISYSTANNSPGVIIKVTESTASNAVIGGTATVLYNAELDGETGVKSRTISGGGVNYIMRNNGAIGVPVTTTTSGQAGSLDTLMDEALVEGSTITQITFAPVIDGSTITLNKTYTAEQPLEVTINGAGTTKTILTGTFINKKSAYTYTYNLNNIKLIDIILQTGAYSTLTNCELTGSFRGGSNAYLYLTGYNSRFYSCKFNNIVFGTGQGVALRNVFRASIIDNCVFSNISNVRDGIVIEAYSTIKYTNTIFTGNSRREDVEAYCINISESMSSGSIIENCSFDNLQMDYAIRLNGSAQNIDVVIKDCSFITNGDGIVLSATTKSTKATFAGTNVINSSIHPSSTNTGSTIVTFENNAIMNFKTNTNENAISGGTVTVPANATVTIIPYGATQASQYVTIEGGANGKTGTYIKNTGANDLA